MCQRCADIVETIKSKGYTEEDGMNFLWNETPFPASHPTEEQFEKVKRMPNKPSLLTPNSSIR